MKRAKQNKLLLIVIAVLVVSGAAAALPVLKKRFAAETPVATSPATNAVKESDMNTLRELGGLFHRLDSVKDFEVRGSVQSTDPEDSVVNQSADYHFARLDSTVYYRIGEQEMLSRKEMFLVIDHSSQQIFVSPPRPFNPGIFPAGEQMARFLTGEGYTVSRDKQKGLNRITLSRPDHITCREYRVSFDDEGFIRETFMRMTNLSDPLNKEKDKTMLMKAGEWKIESPARSIFDASRFVEGRAGAYTAANAFKTYQIILTR